MQQPRLEVLPKCALDLGLTDAEDYDKLKTEILTRLGVTGFVCSQRVHHWEYRTEKPPCSNVGPHPSYHTVARGASRADPKTADQLERSVAGEELINVPTGETVPVE